jgi:hypothetical protein
MILKGFVGDGQGYAATLLRHPIFSNLLGVQIYCGSINVFVSGVGQPALTICPHPFFRRHDDESLDPNFVLRQGCIRFRHCTINGHAAFILRTEHPGPSYRRAPPIPAPHTMFEIVAGTKLPGVAWGTAGEVVFDEGPSQLQTVRVM